MNARPPKSLIHAAASIENLVKAWKIVRSNKGVPGIDRTTIAEFEKDLPDNLSQIARELKTNQYCPMAIRLSTIPKNSGGQREIGILTIKDRVAQRAVLHVLEPIFEPHFVDCNYGFRPGRSIHDAIAKILEYHAQGYDWVVDADIQDFFSTLDHQHLLQRLSEHIPDQKMLHIIELCLQAETIKLGTAPEPGDPTAASSGKVSSLLGHAKSFIGQSIEAVINQLMYGENPYGWTPPAGLGLETPLGPEADLQSTLRKEALKRLGKDSLLLLLSCHKGIVKLITRRGIGLAGSALIAAALLPSIARVFTRYRPPSSMGTVQGGCLSPLLANVYLDTFDKAMLAKGYKLIRYCDDFVILCRSERSARTALKDGEAILTSLHLTLNSTKTRVVPFEDEFKFLGHIFSGSGRVKPVAEHTLKIDWSTVYQKAVADAKKAGTAGKQAAAKGRNALAGLLSKLSDKLKKN